MLHRATSKPGWPLNRLAAMALGASLATAALAAAPPAPNASPLGPRFHARGDDWRLKVTYEGVTFVEKLGRARWHWYGGPPRRVGTGTMRFEGELTHSYAVANEGITDDRSYRLDIVGETCRDDKGRTRPSKVTISFDGDYVVEGCGDALPAS